MSSAESAPLPTTPSGESTGTVGRRHLLRGGAVLAGAAGATALSAIAAQPAHAADGDPVLQGQGNEATSTTRLRIDGTVGDPDSATLLLQNADGPSLQLQALPYDWAGSLAVGQIANTRIGPAIGVDGPDGFETVSYLTTEFDLLALPELQALSPERVVDTRFADQRASIIATPASNFDSSRRLLKGKTMSLAITPADGDVTVRSAFLNVLTVGSLVGGFFSVFPPGAFPPGTTPTTSTLNFAQGQTIANGALVELGVLDGWFAFTLYTSQTSHVIVDLSGIVLEQVPGPLAVARKRGPGVRRHRAARRLPKLLGRNR